MYPSPSARPQFTVTPYGFLTGVLQRTRSWPAHLKPLKLLITMATKFTQARLRYVVSWAKEQIWRKSGKLVRPCKRRKFEVHRGAQDPTKIFHIFLILMWFPCTVFNQGCRKWALNYFFRVFFCSGGSLTFSIAIVW